MILIALGFAAIAATSLILTLSMILRAQRALNARIKIADDQIRELAKLEGRVNRHADDIESLQNRNDVIIKDFNAALGTHLIVLNDHRGHLDHHRGDINEVFGSVQRLLQFCEDSVNCAGAAQRFWDVLVLRNRIPEQELKELGVAIDQWQRNGRLN